jgi:hypothetical protein
VHPYRSSTRSLSQGNDRFGSILLKKAVEAAGVADSSLSGGEDTAMMGERQVRQEALFYGFSLEEHVPADHLLRAIDRFVELSDIRRQLEPFYSAIGVHRSTPS